VLVVLIGGLTVFAALGASRLPPLVHIANLEAIADHGGLMTQRATGWHWALSAIPLGLAVAAAGGVAWRLGVERLGGWLLAAMVLLAGAQLHIMLYPSVYTPLLTSADVLRFTFAATVALGGILELHRIALEHADLLAIEQEQSRRLAELSVLKADFTAMVAHEFSSPLSAIRGFGDVLATEVLDPSTHAQVVDGIQTEVAALTNLVSDVQTAAAVERDDFAIEARPVSLHAILADATGFARTLPGNHALLAPVVTSKIVWADPTRIGQVMRNLLSNAAKYSFEGSPIKLRIAEAGERVRIEVVDHGFGIHPDDLPRIFEKFGRGRDQTGSRVAGVGLGLYLSRRIVQAHGSDLVVSSILATGTTFAFELEIVL
jgi:signal transduction histidine kinase